MKNLDQLECSNISMSSVASVKPRPKTGFIARKGKELFSAAQHGSLKVTLPSGEVIEHQGPYIGPDASIHFKTWTSLIKYKVGGDLAFAEGYMDGDIDTASLLSLFNWYLLNEEALAPSTKPNLFSDAVNKFVHRILNDNSKAGSQKNISFHYDLGNDFYSQWLDETMTYSSADFSHTDNLKEAQTAKYARMAKFAGVADGKSVLEIGCGWGGFAEHALTSYKDITYKGVTISGEQLAFAKGRLAKINQPKESLCFQDYRDIEGTYDSIVSIEMFEAVGEKHWKTYFETIKKLLAEDGKATVQVITIEHQRYLSYRSNVDFIQKYIFPGGMLPSKEAFAEKAAEAGLKVVDQYAFGKSYAETLRRWRSDFTAKWDLLKQQGFDDRFYKMWLYYLEYCEAGFEAETTDVVQFTLTHDHSL